MDDLFEPATSSADALVGPLHTVTCLFNDPAPFEAALQGLDLTRTDWSGDQAAASEYLGLAPGSSTAISGFNRTDSGQNVQVRVVGNDQAGPSVRPEARGQFIGGLSLGFPMLDMPRWESGLGDLGVQSAVGIKEMAFTSPTGEEYISAEVHFPAAENIYLLGVRRPEAFRPVGPMSESAPIGAPAYSARCVGKPDQTIEFYRDVLGFEIRRDATFEVAGPSGLRLAPGTQERFVQAFAPGAATGYLVFLDHADHRESSPAPTLMPPSRGLVMWSFPTAHLDAIEGRVRAANLKVVQAPAKHESPLLPAGRSMIFEDPDGFAVELFEV